MKAIVLAGGSGTRLWPLSREDFPKQFLRIGGQSSLLRRTVERLLHFLPPEAIVILTNEKYKFHVIDDLEGLPPEVVEHIVLEPAARNTAPAMALAVKYCEEKLGCGEDETLLVCPSDHLIRPDDRFAAAARQASALAGKGYLVTFGVKPTRPETGYGYIKIGAKETAGKKPAVLRGKRAGKNDHPAHYLVERFTEKPDERMAKKYVASGTYLWNAGIFVFSLRTMREELEKHAPDIHELMQAGLEDMLGRFPSMPDISIDYAVLERSKRVATIPLDIYWNDVGSWDSLYEVLGMDGDGNVLVGTVFREDTRDTMVIGGERIISTIGLKDVLIVDTPDALLVSKRGDAQKVKETVRKLKGERRKESVESTTVYRPWGNYTILETGPRYTIKRIEVKPGAKLSLQMHHHRSEHWVVLSGTARVTNGDRVFDVHPNESTYIPMSTRHRLENPGKITLQIIEVQNGEYLSEDDIVRFDDVYQRGKNA